MWWTDNSDDSYQQSMGIDLLKIVTTLCEAIEGNNSKEHGLRMNDWPVADAARNKFTIKCNTTKQQVVVITYLIAIL